MPKDPKKMIRTMMVITVIIGLVALAVGFMALAMKEYIIAAAMFLLAGWQIANFRRWKKGL